MKGLKQSTVATVIVGPVLDSAGLAITNAVVGDFRLAKNGTVATLSGATVTHDANGYYLIALTTGNTDTTGRLVLTSGNTAHSMASHHWSVLPASVFDAIYTNATNSTGGLTTATGSITALAGAISTFAGGAVQSVTNPVTVGTNNDKTGYTATVSDKTGFKLASDGLAQVTSWTVAITGSLTGNVTGSVGSISGVTFPANFGSLGIDGSGSILVVVETQELGSGALTANNAGDPIAGIVWNALTTATYTDQSFGDRILISNNNIREISVTGSGHIASVLHDAEPNSIPEDAFQTSALSARALASDAVTEVVNGVWNEPTSGHTTAGTTGKALIDSGAAGNPWSTDLSTGYSGTQAGNILKSVKSQTDLIQAGGTVTVSTPVTASGQLASPLIIGDDYLNANGRAFSWTVALPSGFVAATATCRFGMRYEDDQGVNSFVQSGTVIDAGGGNVTLRFDVAKAVTGLLRPGWYDWSVEIVSASGTEITRVKSGKNAEWQEKQT
jgi:hypothetical protein